MNERKNNIALGDLYELVLKYVAKMLPNTWKKKS